MLNAQVRNLWNEQASRFVQADGSVDLQLLARVLRFAAANLPVADTANLFPLFDRSPQLRGTLVPANLAPAGLPSLDVLTFNAQPRPRVPVATAPTAVALPEAVRTMIVEVATRAQVATGDTLFYSAEGEAQSLCVQAAATAGEMVAICQAQAPDLDALLKKTRQFNEEFNAALVASGKIAAYVLGEKETKALVAELSEIETHVTKFRATAVPTRAPVVRSTPEWTASAWVDAALVLGEAEGEQLRQARQDALERSDNRNLDAPLAARFSEESEAFAATEIAHYLVAEATQSMDDDVPAYLETVLPEQGLTRERLAEILHAAIEAASAHVRPAFRAAGVAPDQQDFSTRQAPAPAPTQPETRIFAVGDMLEWRVGAQTKKRDRVKEVVVVARTINGEAAGTVPTYIMEGGDQVDANMEVEKVPISRSPLYVPAPAYSPKGTSSVSQPLPAVSTDAAVATTSEANEPTVGDWIEFRRPSDHRVCQDMVRRAWQVAGPLGSGKTLKPCNEYTLLSGTTCQDANILRRIDPPALGASKVTAMFLCGSIGDSDEHALLSSLLFRCTPTEFEIEECGFVPGDVDENLAFAEEITTTFRQVGAEVRNKLISSERTDGTALTAWCQARLVERYQRLMEQAESSESTQGAGASGIGSEAEPLPATGIPVNDLEARRYAVEALRKNLPEGYGVDDAQKEQNFAIQPTGECGFMIKAGRVLVPNLQGTANGGQDWSFSFRELVAEDESVGLQASVDPNRPHDVDSAHRYARKIIEKRLAQGYTVERADKEESLGEGGLDWAYSVISHGKIHVDNVHAGKPGSGWAFDFRQLAAEVEHEKEQAKLREGIAVRVRTEAAGGRAAGSAASELTKAPRSVEPSMSELPFSPAEEEHPALAQDQAVSLVRPEELGIDAIHFHQGKFRVWFKTAEASKREHKHPWDTTLPSSVRLEDYELVARIEGAHLDEIFPKLQNGFVDWCEATDPGAKLQRNMEANGHLRRRSLEFGDVVQDEEKGCFYVLGARTFSPIEKPAQTRFEAKAPKWEMVGPRPGLLDPLETSDFEPEVTARAGGRRRR